MSFPNGKFLLPADRMRLHRRSRSRSIAIHAGQVPPPPMLLPKDGAGQFHELNIRGHGLPSVAFSSLCIRICATICWRTCTRRYIPPRQFS